MTKYIEFTPDNCKQWNKINGIYVRSAYLIRRKYGSVAYDMDALAGHLCKVYSENCNYNNYDLEASMRNTHVVEVKNGKF